MRLQDQVAIITGGAGGIGYAAVKRFLAEGAKVVLADYSTEAAALTEQLASDDVLFVKVDVSNKESVQQLVDATLAHFGKIDILINNAGITDDATLHKMTEEAFARVIEINLNGVFLCTQAVIPHFIAQKSGKIINTSSVSGIYGNFGQTNYAATKAGVVGMTKTWAKELGRHGINVNAVAPGFVKTPMVEKMPAEIIEKMSAMVPLQRLGKPVDIANAYVFLASDEASYIHGHTLHVDGAIVM